MDEHALRNQRARLRAAFHLELHTLRDEAIEREMATPTLRARLDDILGRYFGPISIAAFEPNIDAILREYDDVHDVVGRECLFERMLRGFD